jgi:hypothetical protein
MSVTFNPTHNFGVYSDFDGTHGHRVSADTFEVTPSGALIFTSVGSDGATYVTHAISPHSYAYAIMAEPTMEKVGVKSLP